MRLLLALLMLLVMLVPLPVSLAQSSDTTSQSQEQPKIDPGKLLVQPRNADGTVKSVSPISHPVLWLRDKQSYFYSFMQRSIREMSLGSSYAAAVTLMALSFGYGVFHAAGPGHGKAVISAWLLATENELKRGVIVAFLSALVQAITAIAIVSGLLLLAYLVIVSNPGSTSRYLAGVLESTSYALIGVMGLYLIWTAFRPHRHDRGSNDATAHDHHGHHHRHDHQHRHHGDGHDHAHHHHDHHQHNAADCDCGHAHVPTARQVKGDWSWRHACSMAVAIGIRPCSGALLVLLFTYPIGLYWAGVTSTLVMSLGTALTVSAIAAIAVYSKHLARKLARGNDTWLTRLAFGLRIGGGAIIAALGGLMFWASLGTVNAMM